MILVMIRSPWMTLATLLRKLPMFVLTEANQASSALSRVSSPSSVFAFSPSSTSSTLRFLAAVVYFFTAGFFFLEAGVP